MLIYADIFNLGDIVFSSDVKKICISWTSDIVEMHDKQSSNLDDQFELLIVDCEYAKNLWLKNCFHDTRVFKMPYGVNMIKTYNYASTSRKHIISTRNWDITYNQKILLESISKNIELYTNTQCHFAGQGPTLNSLKRLYQSLQYQNIINFLGVIENNRMIDLIAQYKLYISTSLSDGISVSMLEAMAAGTPILVSDIPPNREFITNEVNGFLYISNSVPDLSLRLKDILENNYDLELISKNAHETLANKANWQMNIENLISIMLNL